jgi:hypothetical protein
MNPDSLHVLRQRQEIIRAVDLVEGVADVVAR